MSGAAGRRPDLPYRMHPADRLLAWLLRLNAAVLLLAVVPVVVPTALLADLHARLGLGAFPRDRVTEYLARSASACYVLHGGVLLALSADVRRYRPLLPPVYAMHLGFAAAVVGIDVAVGMPWWWAAAEGGTIAAVAVAVLAVERRTRAGGRSP